MRRTVAGISAGLSKKTDGAPNQMIKCERNLLMKKESTFSYWTLFLSTFYISAFTFGGGYVIVPLMRKRFVEQYGWIQEQEMLDLIAIAQSTPGPIAVNTSILVGYRMAKVKGALLTMIGTVLPPLIILSILSAGYTAFSNNAVVRSILWGMQAGVAAVVANVVIGMAAAVLKQKRWLPIVLMVLAFAAALFLKVNVVFILLACGVIGAADMLLSALKKGGEKA
jgi:chromate transporter